MMSDITNFRTGLGSGLAWYDFICPFCYVGQHRTMILRRAGLDIVELPFQAHPEIPMEGIAAGPRTGAMYVMLEREAEAAGLPLQWPPRLPNTRVALAAAEWTRRHNTTAFPQLQRSLFEAHFAFGEDLGDLAVIDKHVQRAGIDPDLLWLSIEDGSAEQAVALAEASAHSFGVRGTPAWVIGDELISGLRAAADFVRIADQQQQGAV